MGRIGRPPGRAMAKCHPAEENVGGGRCGACYQREWRADRKARGVPTRRFATCHPEREAKGRGLCSTCHGRAWRVERRAAGLPTERPKGPYGQRPTQLAVKYGITVEAYDAMLRGQGGVCAICLEPEVALYRDGRVKFLAVDHCHDRGVVRGLLCARCNIAIGYFQDRPELLDAAAAYLRRTA